jgi:dihydropteroate synthase
MLKGSKTIMADFKLGQYSFCWGKRTYIIVIPKVPPHSFSDGCQFNTLETAVI